MNKLSNVRDRIIDFVNNQKEYQRLVIFAVGLYPFLQYYSNNISEATSWQQFLFIVGVCFVVPQIFLLIWVYIKKAKILNPIRKYGISVLNSVFFLGLIGFLLLNLNKKILLVVILVAIFVGFIIVKHIKKVVVLQLILAVVSIIGLVPKLIFEFNHDNSTWANISSEEMNTTFLRTPNIFVIQPDGYINFSEMNKAPYSFNNSDFETWLEGEGFTNYRDFRSNYYSTYTSNSSMFAMQHHYYTNTNRATLKTHNANEAIVGKYNNVLNILKSNNYKSHLITDNSYFLIDREPMQYDYCNINLNLISYHNSGSVNGADILPDLAKVLDTLSGTNNFFFIEKTLPSHIMYSKNYSKGKVVERTNYLNRIDLANEWIRSLVDEIKKFDENALIILVADHGGLVGLDYTLEAVNRRLNNLEALSTFSSLLSIKWPNESFSENLDYKSNVNLFRNVFYELSKNESLLKNSKDNSSFLPLKDNGKANYYQYIDNEGNFVFNKISN